MSKNQRALWASKFPSKQINYSESKQSATIEIGNEFTDQSTRNYHTSALNDLLESQPSRTKAKLSQLSASVYPYTASCYITILFNDLSIAGLIVSLIGHYRGSTQSCYKLYPLKHFSFRVARLNFSTKLQHANLYLVIGFQTVRIVLFSDYIIL